MRGPADEDMNDWRDAHFAWVVEQQVLKKKHNMLSSGSAARTSAAGSGSPKA